MLDYILISPPSVQHVQERLPYLAYPTLPEEHIRREAGCAFVDGVGDTDIKMKLLLGGEKTVNETLRQALELQAVSLAARPQNNSAKTCWGNRSFTTRERKERQSGYCRCGAQATSGVTALPGGSRTTDAGTVTISQTETRGM
jgi:hypothetical protein